MTQNTVTAQTLKTWIDKDEVIVIDVREPAEFSSGHIAVAKSIPLSQVCASALPQYAGKKLSLIANAALAERPPAKNCTQI